MIGVQEILLLRSWHQCFGPVTLVSLPHGMALVYYLFTMHFGGRILFPPSTLFAISSARYINLLGHSPNSLRKVRSRSPMTGLREGRAGPNDYPTEDEDSRGATCSVTSRDPQPRTLPTHAGDALEGYVMDITDDPNTIEVYDGIVETDSAGFERLGQDPVNVGLTRLVMWVHGDLRCKPPGCILCPLL
jgi:hypothetical protein